MDEQEKKIKRREWSKKYMQKVDRGYCLLPRGTLEKIKRLSGKSCNKFICELVLKELKRLERKQNRGNLDE